MFAKAIKERSQVGFGHNDQPREPRVNNQKVDLSGTLANALQNCATSEELRA